MGYGDSVMATAYARRAKQEHPDKDIYLGNGRVVEWDAAIFEGNPNLTHPDHLRESLAKDRAYFVPHYTGCRPYIRHVLADRVIWNEDHRVEPGDVFLSDAEIANGREKFGAGYILIEPHTKGTFGGNKSWHWDGWVAVAEELSASFDLLQNGVPKKSLPFGRHITASGPRRALQAVANASLVITTDGFLHHAAAALGVPAVVLWGARMNPRILGYESHENLYTGDGSSCGALSPCGHCREGMKRITPDMVIEAARKVLGENSCAVPVTRAS